MITIMLSGTIAKAPETRQSKNGNSYCLASIRVQTAEGDLFASITAFEPLASVLGELQRGDAATIIGNAKVSTYQGRDGDTRAGLSIVATRIIAVTDHQAPPRVRKPKAGPRVDQREYAPDEEIAF